MALDPYSSNPLLSDFVPVEEPGIRALVRRGYEAHAEELGLHGGLGRVVGEVRGGRRQHPIVELSSGERAVVREYRRGGVVRHLNEGRYFLGNRALEELRVTVRAELGGVRVPEVIAAVERAGRVGYTASLATRWIAGAVEVAAWAVGREPAAVTGALHEIGRQIAAMHAAGITHPDLNLRNILLEWSGEARTPAVRLIDFDRARTWSGPISPAVRAIGLRRLARSARKLALSVDESGWRAFREGYGPQWPPYVRLG